MKLHLPKLLRVAILAMFAVPVLAAELSVDNIEEIKDDSQVLKVLNVGGGKEEHTWSGNIVVGSWADSVGDVDAIGMIQGSGDNANLAGKSALGANLYTNRLEVTDGNVILQGKGKIILGGKQSSTVYGGITATNVTVGTDTGSNVTDSPYLFAAMCNIQSLTVNNGTVDMGSGSDCYTGNSSMSESEKKLAQITHSLVVTGGSVSLGQYHSRYYNANHSQTAFGRFENMDFHAATITQSGGAIETNGYTMTASGFTVNQTGGTLNFKNPLAFFGQSGDDAETVIKQDGTTSDTKIIINGMGVATNWSVSAYKPDTMAIKFIQEGTGSIEVNGGIDIETSTAGSIKQDSSGTISLSGAFVPKFNIDQTKGDIELKSGATFTANGAKVGGTLNVENAAVFGIVFNEIKEGEKEYITVTDGDTTSTEDGWNMNAGSVFGINFSQVALDKLTAADDVAATSEKDFAFNLWVAAGADEAKLLNTEFKLVDMDERLWSLKEGTQWVQEGANTYVKGTVEYNPWIKVTEDASEIFSDVSDFLQVGLDIDGNNVKLSGKNTHSYGTKINDAEVTLGNASSLGKGPVSTSGTTTLAGYKYGENSSLPGTIQNSGKLTLTGYYNVNSMVVNHFPEKIVDAYGETGNNGFTYYESFSVQVVENGTNAELNLGNDFRIKYGSLIGEMVEESGTYTGVATFGGGVDYATYLMRDADHEVSVSKIQEASGNQTTTVKLIDGTLKVDGEIEVDAEDGKILTDASCELDGKLADVDVDAMGGTISADITGTSDVTVTGDTTLAGNNTYTGGTVIDGATLTLAENTGVGEGDVQLKGCGTFDMGGNALTNKLIVTGCTLKGAQKYAGEMEVSHELVVEGVAKSKKVTLIGEGTLVRDAQQGGSMTTDAIDVQTTGDATLDVDLTINDNGTVTLNDGKVLMVNGSLTLAGATTLALNGDYAVGDKLLTGNDSLEEGTITLVYNDSTVELERIGNSIVLVSKFKQDKADMAVQANWGIATASRAFVNAVRGQHSHTGCIANGRGTVWAAVLGAYNDMDGADISVQGAAVGVDAKLGRRSTVGISAGYTDGEVSPAGLRDVDQEGNYVALYGEHGLKKLNANSCLSLDWVAAYGQTESKAAGLKWEQDSLQLNTRLNWNKKVTDRLCMSVFGGLEYFASGSDTSQGVKSGSIQNLRGEVGVGARYVAWGTPTVTDGKGGIVKTGCEKLVLNGELRYFNDMVRSNPVIEMDGLRGDGENPGRQGIGIEAGATYRIGERWSASANYSFNAMEDSTEHRVNVGASYAF